MTNIAITSLGCAKNLVDSELILGILQKHGARIVNDIDGAEVIIVNTCGFISEAQKESIETILQFVHLKEKGRIKKIIVAGCLTQNFGSELKGQIPQVDAWIGVNDFPVIASILDKIMRDEKAFEISAAPYIYDHEVPRILLTRPHFAYIKIAEGCNHLCSFCIIPKIKGKLHSRDEESIVKEARELVARGVKELILIAQDTTEYGQDLGNQNALAGLLRKLCAISGDFWIRVLYTYSSHWTDELVDVFAGEEKICNYVDVPIQHVNREILKSMRRSESGEEIESFLDEIRTRIPDVIVRTSVIVGYPGETEKQFDELCRFLRRIKFDKLGAFTYSLQKDSEAGQMKDQLPDQVRNERHDRIMTLQQEISLDNNSRLLGRSMRCIVDGPSGSDDAPAKIVGRTYGDAPEVDGTIYLDGEGLNPGDFVNAEVTGFKEYDLIGKVLKS